MNFDFLFILATYLSQMFRFLQDIPDSILPCKRRLLKPCGKRENAGLMKNKKKKKVRIG